MHHYRIPVHPHIRGAYRRRGLCLFLVGGSSPHTWGIRSSFLLHDPDFRFIPTYVGHTCVIFPPIWETTVHPHIRGAYGHRPGNQSGKCGSSPHTWGIQFGVAFFHRHVRFIPTYVGHTFYRRDGWPHGSVHPHIRGAYYLHSFSHPLNRGSSPHTWGIHTGRQTVGKGNRFIPTYVGHTKTAEENCGNCSVHPHIRGAYTGPP